MLVQELVGMLTLADETAVSSDSVDNRGTFYFFNFQVKFLLNFPLMV